VHWNAQRAADRCRKFESNGLPGLDALDLLLARLGPARELRLSQTGLHTDRPQAVLVHLASPGVNR
jgi:hypothetical protein